MFQQKSLCASVGERPFPTQRGTPRIGSAQDIGHVLKSPLLHPIGIAMDLTKCSAMRSTPVDARAARAPLWGPGLSRG
eukprot:3618484-Pyramimonas_sp.AAC.1